MLLLRHNDLPLSRERRIRRSLHPDLRAARRLERLVRHTLSVIDFGRRENLNATLFRSSSHSGITRHELVLIDRRDHDIDVIRGPHTRHHRIAVLANELIVNMDELQR